MALNKQKGNMYSFFNQPPYRGCTWNPIKGLCPYKCSYCFMRKMYKQYKWDEKFRLDEKCFKDNLGSKNYIFVGSSTDMWCNKIKREWIEKVLKHCEQFPDNQYFFQSKNPMRFIPFYRFAKFPFNSIITTTMETNRQELINEYSNAPDIAIRYSSMASITIMKKMITIEPIMDFDLNNFLGILQKIGPIQVNIGADSGHNHLPEPPKEKIEGLITELKKITTVHLKDNLKRLLK